MFDYLKCASLLSVQTGGNVSFFFEKKAKIRNLFFFNNIICWAENGDIRGKKIVHISGNDNVDTAILG